MMMIGKLLIFLALAVVPSSMSLAQSFRGLPYFVKIRSLSVQSGTTAESDKRARVCYRFGTTIPIFDYTDLASRTLKGLNVKRRDTEGSPLNGDPQPDGVEFQFSVFGVNLTAYLQSPSRAFSIQQLEYFNSGVRTIAAIPKPMQLESFEVNYQDMTDPQYEWLETCETISFPRAYSERYIRALFQGPGPIGHLNGAAQFFFQIFTPPFLSPDRLTATFRDSVYATPVFGLAPLDQADYRMIALSHFVNSLNAVRENLDEEALNAYLQAKQEVVQRFEEEFGIQVILPISAERLVQIIQEVAGVQSILDGPTDF